MQGHSTVNRQYSNEISHKRTRLVSSSTLKNHLVTELKNRGHKTASIGKVADLFNGEGFDFLYPTNGNTEGIEQIIKRLRANERRLSIR